VPQRAPSWIARLASLGDRPGDDPELRLRLRFMIATAVAMACGGIVWGALALALGLVWQSAIPLGYTAITALNLAVLARSKRFPPARAVQVLISLLLPFLTQWSLGGFVPSGGVMLWALLSLTAAMSFGGLRIALVWLGLFLVLTAVSVVVDPYLVVPDLLTDARVTRALFAVNAAAVGVAVFGLTSAFLHLRHRLALELAERNRQLAESQAALVQSEKMAALGRLSAGMAHELNNPAAAAQRGAKQLGELAEGLRRVCYHLGEAGLDAAQVARLEDLDEHARQLARAPLALDAIERMDREGAIQDWLDARLPGCGIDAAALVDLGLAAGSLDELLGVFGARALPQVLGRAVCWHAIAALLHQIHDGAGRVVRIVDALKSYTYLDRASLQSVDLHAGLEDTLLLLEGGLRDGVTVRREYDRTLPRLTVRGRALNQVWTSIIENAISAMNGHGELVLRSRRDGGSAVIEIIDSGPGIAPEIVDCVFDPFVTTKPVGAGAGLGLHIARNIVVEHHGGSIQVESVPGRTCFAVRLPLGEGGGGPV
jgi:signal transduction histidine kinase